MDINRYRIISRTLDNDMGDIKISAHIPSITESDYQIGFIRRYFVQKGNDKASPIFEVNVNEYQRIILKPIYIGVFTKWRISGPITETLSDSVLDRGVRESNRISISLVLDKMPNLQTYLPNLLQFHK